MLQLTARGYSAFEPGCDDEVSEVPRPMLERIAGLVNPLWLEVLCDLARSPDKGASEEGAAAAARVPTKPSRGLLDAGASSSRDLLEISRRLLMGTSRVPIVRCALRWSLGRTSMEVNVGLDEALRRLLILKAEWVASASGRTELRSKKPAFQRSRRA